MNGYDLLAMLAPPLSLLDKLEGAGKLPPEIEAWRQLWITIRGDGPSPIDGVGQEIYQQALIVVEEKAKRKAKAY